MKKSSYILILLCDIVASLVLAAVCIRHPDWFPQIPSSFSRWLVDAYGAKTAEEVSDLEFLLFWCISFIVISIITYIVLTLRNSNLKSKAHLS